MTSSSPSAGAFRGRVAAMLLAMPFAVYFMYTFLASPIGASSLVVRRSADFPDGYPNSSRPFRKRIIHIDLKGAPPRPSFYPEFFNLAAKLGADGILMEYEDMFPYEGRLEVIRARNAYTKEEIRGILKAANESGLEVIPLVQTFGHLEFLLKHKQFDHLREHLNKDDSICPSKNESFVVISDLLQQVHALHPDSKRIHIGSDEVYQVAEDQACQQRLIHELHNSTELLKLLHIAKTASFARSLGFEEVFVWNDMFDKAPVSLMKEVKLGELVTPVVWGYAVDVTREDYFPNGLFARISQVFPRIWFASAYKGANGQANVFMEIERYLANQQSYVNLYKQFQTELADRVQGIMLTGWQRFSHHNVLCELLPVAIPSLVVNMIFLANVNASPMQMTNTARSMLNCPSRPDRSLFESKKVLEFTFFPSKEQVFQGCDFQGNEIFSLMQDLRFLSWKYRKTEYLDQKGQEEVSEEVTKIEPKLKAALSRMFFDDAVEEFLRQVVSPLRETRFPRKFHDPPVTEHNAPSFVHTL